MTKKEYLEARLKFLKQSFKAFEGDLEMRNKINGQIFAIQHALRKLSGSYDPKKKVKADIDGGYSREKDDLQYLSGIEKPIFEVPKRLKKDIKKGSDIKW